MRVSAKLGLMSLLIGLVALPAQAQDEPDPYFFDENADGIDGVLANAVFVAPPPTGVNGAGRGLTPADPVATITFGISRALATGRSQVLVQVGTYAETVTVSSGISIHGGYGAAFVRVPSTESVATRIQGGTTAVLMNNVDVATTLSFLTILSASAASGASSYAVRLVDSSGAVFRYCRFEPGNGSSAIDATNAPPRTPAQSPGGNNGQNAEESTATTALVGPLGNANSSCPDASNIGGKGGNGGVGETGLHGMQGGDGSGLADGGGGGSTSTTMSDGGNGNGGQDGTDGTNGAHASASVAVVGTISGAGFYLPPQGAAGLDGGHGTSGGGGGGGGGQDCQFGCNPDLGATGGSGGSGGCAGVGASSGAGGGGTFGILVDADSDAIISHSYFEPGIAGQGGDGGNGGAPQTGGDGGIGGLKLISSNGGAGGDGGDGGDGGNGGSGAGGHGGPAIGIFDPVGSSVVSNLRYLAGFLTAAGANGSGNTAVRSAGILALRHPTAATPLGSPAAGISAFTIVEPAIGTTTAYIPMTLSVPFEGQFSAAFTVASDTATGSGVDYTLANGSATFNPWTTQANIAVQVHADAENEGGETFTVTLTGSGSGQATITIVEDGIFANGFE